MAARVEAIVKPELIAWARKSIGLQLEEAARKIGVKVEQLRAWEEGRSRPTVKQLRKAARVYKRPMAVFYLSKPPKDFSALRDFRQMPGELERPYSAALVYAIRLAHQRREVALEISEALGEKIAPFTASEKISCDVEVLATRARALLGIGLQEQIAWSSVQEAFNTWRQAIEHLGILVFQVGGIKVEEMRGFSISATPLPVIGINAKDAYSGRVFTLIHEFAHLLLHSGGVCDLRESESINIVNLRNEAFFNLLAGEILVPRRILETSALVVSTKGARDWSDDELESLSQTFRVSKEVILRRLLILGRARTEYYRAKRQEYLEIVQQIVPRSKGGFAPPFRKVIAYSGKPFTRLVIEAYHQEAITAGEVSDYLGVRLKHLPKIEDALWANRGSLSV